MTSSSSSPGTIPTELFRLAYEHSLESDLQNILFTGEIYEFDP